MSIQNVPRQIFSQENSNVLQRKNEAPKSTRKAFTDRSVNMPNQFGSVKKNQVLKKCKNTSTPKENDLPDYLADVCTKRGPAVDDYVIPEFTLTISRNIETPPPNLPTLHEDDKFSDYNGDYLFEIIQEKFNIDDLIFKDVKEPEEFDFEFNF